MIIQLSEQIIVTSALSYDDSGIVLSTVFGRILLVKTDRDPL